MSPCQKRRIELSDGPRIQNFRLKNLDFMYPRVSRNNRIAFSVLVLLFNVLILCDNIFIEAITFSLRANFNSGPFRFSLFAVCHSMDNKVPHFRPLWQSTIFYKSKDSKTAHFTKHMVVTCKS